MRRTSSGGWHDAQEEKLSECPEFAETDSGNRASFCEAQTLEEAAFAANEINARKRRDKKEFKEVRKHTRLAALLPRWCPDESAGE